MKSGNPRILTINGGSSSIKFALFEAGDPSPARDDALVHEDCADGYVTPRAVSAG